MLAVAAGYACGRIAGSLLPVASATAAGLAGFGLACTTALNGLTGHEGLGAAQWTLATGAACCAAWAARQAVLQSALWLLAAAITLTAVMGASEADWMASGGVLLCALVTARLRQRLLGLAAFALIAAAAAGGCWAVAEDAVPGGLRPPCGPTDRAPDPAVAGPPISPGRARCAARDPTASAS